MTQTGIQPWTNRLKTEVIESARLKPSISTVSYPLTLLKKTYSRRVYKNESLVV